MWTKFISASETHIKWLRKKIINLLDVKGYFWEQKPWMPYQTTSVWEIRFAKKESIKLLSQLYYNKNVPCLVRKRKIAEKFI